MAPEAVLSTDCVLDNQPAGLYQTPFLPVSFSQEAPLRAGDLQFIRTVTKCVQAPLQSGHIPNHGSVKAECFFGSSSHITCTKKSPDFSDPGSTHWRLWRSCLGAFFRPSSLGQIGTKPTCPASENLGGGHHTTADAVSAMGTGGYFTGGKQPFDRGFAFFVDPNTAVEGVGEMDHPRGVLFSEAMFAQPYDLGVRPFVAGHTLVDAKRNISATERKMPLPRFYRPISDVLFGHSRCQHILPISGAKPGWVTEAGKGQKRDLSPLPKSQHELNERKVIQCRTRVMSQYVSVTNTVIAYEVIPIYSGRTPCGQDGGSCVDTHQGAIGCDDPSAPTLPILGHQLYDLSPDDSGPAPFKHKTKTVLNVCHRFGHKGSRLIAETTQNANVLSGLVLFEAEPKRHKLLRPWPGLLYQDAYEIGRTFAQPNLHDLLVEGFQFFRRPLVAQKSLYSPSLRNGRKA